MSISDLQIETGFEKETLDVSGVDSLLPRVGFKFVFDEENLSKKYFWLVSEKYGWEQGDNIEVVKHIDNDEGVVVAVCLNTQSGVLNSACLHYDFFESPEVKEERERLESINEITDFLNSLSPHCKEKMEYVARAIVDKTGYRKK